MTERQIHRLRVLVTGSGLLAAFADIRVDSPNPETGFLSLLVVFRAAETAEAAATQHVRDELAAVGSVRLSPAQTGADADLRLVGDRVIQTFDLPTFLDTDLLSAVAAAHGGPRSALLITDDPTPPDAADAHSINTSHRMRLSDLSGLRA